MNSTLKKLVFLILIISNFSSICWAQEGQNKISVLVIDSPIDYSHPDLVEYKPEIKPCNLVTGQNFTDVFIMDTSSFEDWEHGTHVSGIIASHLNKNSENKVVIHNGVFFPPANDEKDGEDDSVNDIKKQIREEVQLMEEYIRKTKPKVVNMSFGESSTQLLMSIIFAQAMAELDGISKKQALSNHMNIFNDTNDYKSDLMKKMMAKFPDTLFVIAAGNDHTDLDRTNEKYNFRNHNQFLRKLSRGKLKGVHTYLSQINLPNTIVVGSVDAKKIKPASFTNHSNKHVDIFAEGDKIMSTAPGGNYLELSGTSMAAPQVSGVAASILQENPSMTASEVKNKIIEDASTHFRLRPYVVEGRLLNVSK